MADDDVQTDSQPDIQPAAAPPQSDDVLQASEASQARETATRSRQRVQPPTISAPEYKPPAEGENPFAQFVNDPKDDGIALMERLRLNRQDSYYRSSLAGSMRLAALSHIASTPDGPDVDPDRKRVNDEQRDEYHKITADLAAHDLLKPWDTTLEAAAAFGGQLEGTLISPESWIGWGAKGATWLGRAARAGLQQAGIQAATDPAVQALNTAAGVQQGGWDWQRTVVSAGLGFLIGGGGHVAGEGLEKVIGPRMARRQLLDLVRQDKSFENHMINETTLASLDPANGRALGLDENVPINSERPQALSGNVSVKHSGAGDEGVSGVRGPNGEQQSELLPGVSREVSGGPNAGNAEENVRNYGAGPEHGFEDTVAAEKTRLSQSYGAAQPKAKKLNDDARFSAFHKEVGPQAEQLLTEHGFDPKDAHELYQHYDRAPGEHPDEALKRASIAWYDTEERAALSDPGLNSQWRADMAELERHFASREGESGGTSDGGFRSGDRPGEFGPAQGTTQGDKPRGDDLYGRPESDIPFESGVPAREGGAVAEGGTRGPPESRDKLMRVAQLAQLAASEAEPQKDQEESA